MQIKEEKETKHECAGWREGIIALGIVAADRKNRSKMLTGVDPSSAGSIVKEEGEMKL